VTLEVTAALMVLDVVQMDKTAVEIFVVWATLVVSMPVVSMMEAVAIPMEIAWRLFREGERQHVTSRHSDVKGLWVFRNVFESSVNFRLEV
jgi:hypothetical protein